MTAQEYGVTDFQYIAADAAPELYNAPGVVTSFADLLRTSAMPVRFLTLVEMRP